MANPGQIVAASSQSLTSILFGKTRVQFIKKGAPGQGDITVITIDASINETHSRKSPPTRFPVESGQTISDHMILEPFSLEIEGMISDTPIGGLSGFLTEGATALAAHLVPPATLSAVAGASSLVSAIAKSKSPSAAAYLQLIQIQEDGLPFDVLTTLFRYPSMWIESISVPRNAQNGNCLLFTVKLVQLLIVKPQTVNIQIFANSNLSANKTNVGSQSNSIAEFKKGVNTSTGILNSEFPGGTVGVPR